MTGFLRVKSFYRGWIRERRRMGRVIAARKREEEEQEEEEEERRAWEWERVACLLVFVGMRMCERVHARLSERMRADTWRSHHIVESSLPVWAVLYLSLAPSFPFYSLPLSFVLFSLPSFFPVFFFTSLCLLLSPLSLFFLFKLSLTMVQDFYCLGRRGNNWQRWVGWIGRDGWLYWINVGISEFHFEFGER